eukprot:CAMPEP_0117657174 /NCGR_PEP_ID=MMETSP0804-20121206/5192_1 /TAXON_ID=1074897 /ORGANISM="Tetraselmis astigmatica, Strain CCMP880" /LENGTH=50 /DNA_ID=CAMNT_0005463615 /DNA_START=2401 /DNA_END=2549 /DNA_ORIENTATION=-
MRPDDPSGRHCDRQTEKWMALCRGRLGSRSWLEVGAPMTLRLSTAEDVML